jgi:hypothetical protein
MRTKPGSSFNQCGSYDWIDATQSKSRSPPLTDAVYIRPKLNQKLNRLSAFGGNQRRVGKTEPTYIEFCSGTRLLEQSVKHVEVIPG